MYHVAQKTNQSHPLSSHPTILIDARLKPKQKDAKIMVSRTKCTKSNVTYEYFKIYPKLYLFDLAHPKFVLRFKRSPILSFPYWKFSHIKEILLISYLIVHRSSSTTTTTTATRSKNCYYAYNSYNVKKIGHKEKMKNKIYPVLQGENMWPHTITPSLTGFSGMAIILQKHLQN